MVEGSPGRSTTGYNTEAAYDPTNDMTLVVWRNLTLSPSPVDKYTAQTIMVKVFDQIYALSRLASVPTTTTP